MENIFFPFVIFSNYKEIFLYLEQQKWLVAFGHVNSLKITIELQKQSLWLSERTNVSGLENMNNFGTEQNCTVCFKNQQWFWNC